MDAVNDVILQRCTFYLELEREETVRAVFTIPIQCGVIAPINLHSDSECLSIHMSVFTVVTGKAADNDSTCIGFISFTVSRCANKNLTTKVMKDAF